MKKRFAILFFAVSLTGCAQWQQQQRQQAFKDEMQAASQACTAAYETANLSLIAGKIRTKPAEPFSLSMLNDKSKATPEEAAAISEIDKAIDACNGERMQVIGKYYPAPYRQTLYETTVDAKKKRAQLYGSEITYGEYNTSIQDLEIHLSARIQELDRQFAAVRAQEQANREKASADAMNTMAAGLLMMQASQPRYVAPAPSLPQQTNCTTYGNRTNCTTW